MIFADDPSILLAKSQSDSQEGLFELSKAAKCYKGSIRISLKTKSYDFQVSWRGTAKS